MLGRETPVIVAGSPESTPQLQAAAWRISIHIRSNPIEVLCKMASNAGDQGLTMRPDFSKIELKPEVERAAARESKTQENCAWLSPEHIP